MLTTMKIGQKVKLVGPSGDKVELPNNICITSGIYLKVDRSQVVSFKQPKLWLMQELIESACASCR